ncbi:MAG: (d)CMP kinase [Thiohalomonadales bacterium]
MRQTSSTTVPVITVDGPSASGKGTVSRHLADKLAWHLLDSGALYRLTGLAALLQGIALDDETALKKVAEGLDIEFRSINNEVNSPIEDSSESSARADMSKTAIFLFGKDVTRDIRSETCSQAASKVAVLNSVRQALLTRQRDFRCHPGLIADGRDMGSVVFKDASLKVFITASVQERARRRYEQLIGQQISVSLPDLLAEIQERDARDSSRSSSPLVQPAGSVLIDTTHMTVSMVVGQILSLWEQQT